MPSASVMIATADTPAFVLRCRSAKRMSCLQWSSHMVVYCSGAGAAHVTFGRSFAGVIQLVECQLPKLDVVGSSPIARSSHLAPGSGGCTIPLAGRPAGCYL